MDSHLLKRALDIADDALEMNENDRVRYLTEACGDDASLQAEVEALLDHAGGLSIVSGRDPAAMPAFPPISDRFVIRQEIARGGMGTIYSAEDKQLNREVAVKVLQDRFLVRPDIIERFFNEAKICGRMQHPGTPPVYAFGTLEDGRPFIAMKLVQGETLTSILTQSREEKTTASLLSIFKRICQTIAYAHSVGIIHRDLKPDNVMVSQFGDVQVMDWGLAKVLEGDLSHDHFGEETHGEHVDDFDETLEGTGSGMTTRAGFVMGTPAYMPPEQVRGERARTVDVFQLGAILCEILTGSPPYHSDSPLVVYSMAKEGELDDALDRLDRAEVDGELIKIARKCLEFCADKRFANAGQLTEAIDGYLGSVQSRLREAELSAAKTETKIAEERKRRNIVTGLSTIIAAAVIASLAGLSWAMILRAQNAEDTAAHAEQLAANAEEITTQTEELARLERIENEHRNQIKARFNRVLLETTRLFERARASSLNDQESWKNARDAIARAESFVELNPEIQPRSRALSELKSSFEETEAELKIALAITKARDATFDDPEFVPWGDTRPKLNKLDRVVSDNGFHPDSHADEPIIVKRIQSLPWAIREQLIGAMDEWYLTADASHRETFTKILTDSDHDPLRTQWRTAFTQGDEEALKQIFMKPVTIQLPSRTLVNLIRSLESSLDANTRIDFLERNQSVHRYDAWYNYLLADLLQANNRVAESIRYYQAFLMARPNHRTRVFLAYALLRLQMYAEAIPHLEEAVRERGEIRAYQALLIHALMRSGRFEEAVAACRRSLRIDPKHSNARLALADALMELGHFEESIKQLTSHRGETLPEDSWQVSVLLADALHRNGQSLEALKVFETIDLERNPLLVGQLSEKLCEMAEVALKLANQEPEQNTHWRERARQWLQICLGVQDFDSSWFRSNASFTAMRSEETLAELPETERHKWQSLWNRAENVSSTSSANAAFWKPISPSGLNTDSEAQLLPQTDGSLLVEGKRGPRDIYTVRFQTDAVTAIKLELMPDQRNPNGGHIDLGEFALEVVSNDSTPHAEQFRFARCVAERESSGLTVERCIDGNLKTTWQIKDAAANPQTAVFVLEHPVALRDDEHFRLHLRQGGSGDSGIGRFRLFVTDRPFATKLELPTLMLSRWQDF